MAQRHLLHELLKEDQEPFFLKSYISDKLTQLKIPNNNNSSNFISNLQLKKQKQQPIQQNTPKNFPLNLCKDACFPSLPNTTSTPDIRKSPLFQFSSPAKSPCRSPNTIFLHIPARTAAILLEAAAKILQKQSKTKTPNKSHRFGLYLGSFFKRLTKQGSRSSKKGEIECNNNNAKVKDIMRFDSFVNRRKASNGKRKLQENITNNVDVVVTGVCSCEVGFTCFYCNAVWSESKQDNNKSLDMETLSTRYDSDDEERENTNGAFYCESPFHFVLQRSPSAASGCQTPDFSSPVSTPSHRRTEDNECDGHDNLNKFQSSEEEEEEKEQCSPVSVLDPPFEDDYDYVHENDDEEDDFDSECNYANVQRAKQQLLLYKLHRFVKLSDLDPLNLEKRMLDQEEDKNDSETSSEEKELREVVFEILCHSSVHDNKLQVPEDLKRLVYDLIMEEGRELNFSKDRDMVIRRVCRRLELWKEVESDTIHMMIEEDLSREKSGWKKNAEQIRDLAGELELSIFEFLVMEFSEELLC
ncbi:hypothetical protein RIF29_20608 [Crotalaria pallida]|uniref:DUF4378 domain-containing protein n=1 Tax=Crotalaria pallida TaxID=3830 RepID=A0AAN9F1W7_CROPI